MYTETQQAIRNSLWNFMGSLLTASSLDNEHAKESVVAIISEEMCKFIKDEDATSIDMNAAKPLLKSVIWILDAKILELNNTLKEAPEVAIPIVNKNIEDVKLLKQSLQNFIGKI